MPYDDRLKCMVEKIDYDFNTRQGTVWTEDGTCTEMSGCVGFFEQIDPSVRRIVTHQGKELDTLYKREGHEWRAIARVAS
jgi:hypothetical protein